MWIRKNCTAFLMLLASICVAAESSDTQVVPFVFKSVSSDFDSQYAEWDRLLKYKLWGTGESFSRDNINGIYGVVFNNQNVAITDSVGYSGSALGGLGFYNDKHHIGGPLAFAGDFVNGTGDDHILTGPSHFGGSFTIGTNAYNNNNMELKGVYCIESFTQNMDRGLSKGGGKIDCSDSLMPALDKTLDVPTVDYTGYTFNKVVEGNWNITNKIETVEIPEGSGYYDIHVTGDLHLLDSNDSLYVSIPTGRVARFFVDGSIIVEGSLHNIVTFSPEFNNQVENKDYAGNLLFYSPKSIAFPAQECTIQGTYISGGKISFMQHYRFAGQILAKQITIDADFMAGDFRYVPFNPSKIKLLVSSVREDDGEKDIQLSLDKEPPTNVPFRYCFEFPATDPLAGKAEGNLKAHRNDVLDEDIPVCSTGADGKPVGDFVWSYFEAHKTQLTNPIILHPNYDALTENTEVVNLWVCDLEAAIFSDGDRTKTCSKLKLSIKDVPKNPISHDVTVTGFMDDTLVIDSFPVTNPNGTVLKDYFVRFESIVSVGSLLYKGVAVKKGDVLDADSLKYLKFVGKPGEFGSPYDSFDFTIIRKSDNAETIQPYTMSIDLVSVIFYVEENTKAGTFVGKMVSDFKSPTFVLNDPSGKFVIDATTGVVTVKADSTLDYEVTDGYFATVDIVNGTNTKSVAVKFAIIDVDDPPFISDTTMTVQENKPVGTSVGFLNFYDQDGVNSGFRNNVFTIIGGDSSLFKIDSRTAEITTREVFDYEALPADKKYFVITVQVKDDHDYVSVADVTINIKNEVETSEIVVTHAETGTGRYNVDNPPSIIKINENDITISWTADNTPQPDTTLVDLHEGCITVTLTYKDETKDYAAKKDIQVCVSTRTPDVAISTKGADVKADNIYTIVEQIAAGDTSFYVNGKENKIDVVIKNPIVDASYTDSTCNYSTDKFSVNVVLDTFSSIASDLKVVKGISEQKIMLNETPSKPATCTLFNDSLVLVRYTEKVNGKDVQISYTTNAKGDIVGKQMTVSYETKIDGRVATVSYLADAFTGEVLKNNEGGVYTFAYDYTDKNGKTMTISYGVNDKGVVMLDAEGNVGFNVGYTYVNDFGNMGVGNIRVVLDVIKPYIEILYPHMDDVLFSNYVDVEWCVSTTGDSTKCLTQDTLKTQGLERGANTIVRFYRDKAGNLASDTVYVIMKDAKDVDISVETPVTLVTREKTEEYYSANAPEKGESYAISIYNSKTGKEIETQVGGDFGTKDGSRGEPYPGLEKHLGPTLMVEAKVPVVSAMGGLATLDDLVDANGMIPLDGIDAASGKKVSVDEYVKEHCSLDFQSTLGSDISQANLYHTVMQVKVWVFTTLGSFVDYFSFEQELDKPEYANEGGILNLYFEQKPDKEGFVRTADGRLYATGAYLYKTEVTMTSKLHCDLLPIADTNSGKQGTQRKVSEDLLKPFGYKRPDYK